MTLCIAWKQNNQVHFASDSRAKIGKVSFNHAIKVFSVPVKIIGPIGPKDHHPSKYYEQNIGICFSGNILNGYTLKETLIYTLSKLQVVPGITDVSMDQICKLIAKFYNHYSVTLSELLFERGLSIVLVTGYCPKLQKVRTFKFKFDIGTSVTTNFNEILVEDGDIEFIGSGETQAKILFKKITSTPPLEILKQVIIEQKEPTVGGAIQFGEIKLRDFEVCGIRDYLIDHTSRKVTTEFYFNGLPLMEDPYAVKWDEFFIKQTFKDPFINTINQLLESGYTLK
ncbi:MAG: hypothetical protein ACHQQQ_09130 [Bacteroidota bacterium]